MKRLNNSKISMVLFVFAAAIVLAGSANADFNFGTPVNLGPSINSSSGEGGMISPDDCTMYIASDRPGGYGDWDVYVATRESRDSEWGPAVHLEPPLSTVNADIVWSISVDGLSLYLYSDRPGGRGNFDIWVTTRATTSAPWGTPVNLGSTINSSSYEYQPDISSDGLSLYFSSNRAGGRGSYDLWVTTRTTTSAPWGTPTNLGSTVNSSSGDYQPSISADGLSLFFVSVRPGGLGYDEDIWVTTRASVSDPWGTPVNLGPQINTPAADFCPSISADGSTFYFTSSGRGGYGYYDVFQALIFSVPTCGDLEHPYPVGDLNEDCHVDIADLEMLIDHWLECTAPDCE